jgi:hypothetical protein
MQCEDPDARNLNVDPEWPGSEPVGVYLGTTTSNFESGYNWAVGPDVRIPAQRVIVPERYIISTISTTDANNQAVQLAESLLACCYINDRIFIECPEEANRDYSPTWSYEVPRGTFVSCKSKKDANDQAWASAEGIVDCIYCNDVVLPQCVPNWVVDAVTTGIMLSRTIEMNGAVYPEGSVFKLPLPLNVDGLVNPYTGEPVNVADWSMDATIGVAKDTVCSTSKREVDEIVELLPAVVTEPKTGVPACRFKSTRLIAGCSFVDPYNPKDQTGGSWHGSSPGTASASTLYEPSPITYYGTDSDGKRYRAYKAKPTRSLSSKLSQPTPGKYIDFPEGLFVATAADVPEYKDRVNDLTLDEAEQIVKNYLDALVLELAKSVIDCRYANPRTVVDCTYKRSTPSYSGKRRSGDIVGDGYKGYDDPVALAKKGWKFGWSKSEVGLAPGSTHPSTRDNKLTIIEAGTFQSSKYQEVLKQTKAMAESLLYCKYINDPRSCSTGCGDTHVYGAHLVSETGDYRYVAKGTIIADSVAEANTLADAMVKCNDPVCLYGNDSITKTCECTAPGASTTTTTTTTMTTIYYGSATVDADMFVGPDPEQVADAAVAHVDALCELDCLSKIPSEDLFLSAELTVSCSSETTESCSLPPAEVSNSSIEYKVGSVELKRIGPSSIVLPKGMFASKVESEVAEQGIQEFASQFCFGMWTNAAAVSYTTRVSVVSFLYKPGKTGDGTTSGGPDTYLDYTNHAIISEVYTLQAGAVVAESKEGVCMAIDAIARTGIYETSRAATVAASRWLAGVADEKSKCGEVCSIEYVSGQAPLINNGTIQINYATSADGTKYGGVIKSIEASSSAVGYLINDGVIQIPYANKAASGGSSVYGVIGDVQEVEGESAMLALENGVLKIPKSSVNITGIEYDENVTAPEISDGKIKLSIAEFSSDTSSDGQLGGMKGVSIMTELTAPRIVNGVLELNPASTSVYGLVAGISSAGESLSIDKGTINIPKADKASSRLGLVSNIEAATDSNWDIASGVIKVALADAGAAGLIKEAKIDEKATEASIAAGVITIPVGKYTFEAPWLEETNGNVKFVESQLDAKAAALAPTISSKIKSTATAAIDTYSDTSSNPPNGSSGTIRATITTTSGTSATASFTTNRNS